jgi:DNA-binding NarL/FixJ family response regulator
MKNESNPRQLTRREMSALELVLGGSSDIEIALLLGVERSAVHPLLEMAMEKMQAQSASEAADKAHEEGLIGPGMGRLIRRWPI